MAQLKHFKIHVSSKNPTVSFYTSFHRKNELRQDHFPNEHSRKAV